MLNMLNSRRLLVAILLMGGMIATMGGVLAQASSPAQVADDDHAIRAVWSTIDASWNARNVEQFVNLYTDDVSFVFVDRQQSLAGRAEVQQRFAVQFPGMAPDLRHVTHVHAIRSIAAGAASVDGIVEILRVDSDAEPEVLRRFSIFAVMVRRDQGWKIRDLRIYQLTAGPESE